MNLILLSGGSGKRLWPLSNDVRSKQFIKLFPSANGERESMLQRMYRGIAELDSDARIVIAASKSQVPAIHNQLGNCVGISIEPCRKDTFPAIALACGYLHEKVGISREETVVVCPADPYVDAAYFRALKKLDSLMGTADASLLLMGVEPTFPSTQYGYILPEEASELSKVKTFREKPNEETAKEYIAQGALWNAGVFAFRLGYLLDRAHEQIVFQDYDDLFEHYEDVKKISFDYAVSEKERNISVFRFAGRWDDVGSWNSLTNVMDTPVIGKGILSEDSEDSYVLNELDIPVLGIGLKNTVVSASPQGILVSDRCAASGIKSYVEAMDQRVMFAEKSWGVFHVLDVEEDSLTIKATIKAGDHMNYHSHEHRDEVWTICSGKGRVVVDGMEQAVSAGDVITIQAGCRHTIFALTDLALIEIQLGKEIRADDKIKYEWDETD